ncbi:MAG: hypothetical protein JNL98_17710 [Bryobacterales bacterium]|nr:hypothetical protein [Bryobacterales bacterium]
MLDQQEREYIAATAALMRWTASEIQTCVGQLRTFPAPQIHLIANKIDAETEALIEGAEAIEPLTRTPQ